MNQQNDLNAINKAVEQWLVSLDNGDLQGMLDTCDPEVLVANEKSPTTIGIEHVRIKYEPRIKTATFISSFEIEHIAIYDNFSLVVGHFNVKATHKKTSETTSGSGRLALGYRRLIDGSWKLVFDMDNNA